MKSLKVTYLGGAGTVTGSKFFVEFDNTRVLIDCGLFQGLKSLRLRNWQSWPFEPKSLDAVLLTHAHLDHSGALPILVREGFSGPIYCTAPTRDVSEVLLRDAGRIQEEDTEYANLKGFSKHKPALPLFTEADAVRSLGNFHTVALGQTVRVKDLGFHFFSAGHILGAASVLMTTPGKTRLLFSGDLGNSSDPLLPPPHERPEADIVFVETTYGDRRHPEDSPEKILIPLLQQVQKNQSVLLIPAFAVGRTQNLMYHLSQIFSRRPDLTIPLYLNSPMAQDVTQLYLEYGKWHSLSEHDLQLMKTHTRFVKTTDESKKLNQRVGPMVIISASGMLTGGRVLHHLEAFAEDPKNIILLPGFQAAGTRGFSLANGLRDIKLHGRYLRVQSQIVSSQSFSAHADQKELLDWLALDRKDALPLNKIRLIHGEPAASDCFRRLLEERRPDIECLIPDHGSTETFAI
jgi:metallo-beta-lactamase family protein